jgi:hypothetical protein
MASILSRETKLDVFIIIIPVQDIPVVSAKDAPIKSCRQWIIITVHRGGDGSADWTTIIFVRSARVDDFIARTGVIGPAQAAAFHGSRTAFEYPVAVVSAADRFQLIRA